MAEPLTPQPEKLIKQSVIIGETPIYLFTPLHVGDQDIQSLTILAADKRANDGIGSAVPLVSEVSRKKGDEGKMIDKPLTNLNAFDEIAWDKVSGLQWTDESGEIHTIPKEELSLEQRMASSEQNIEKGEQIAEKPKITLPEKPPILPSKEARQVLETLTEDPNTITIVGLKAYETRALTLADRSMQKLSPIARNHAEAERTLWEKTKDATHGLHELIFTTIWKQSIGGIYFHEKARQYYLDMLKAAETPFAEDAIRLAERRATDIYNQKLADSNFVVSAGTKAIEWFKDKVGMRTTIQKLALEEMAAMKSAGEISGMETFEREAKAVRARFGADFDKADQFVRKHLGEKLEILDPENAEHAPLVSGIQDLLKQYASGEIPDKIEFDKRTKEFFTATLKNVRPDIFAEAELYSSSLFDAAETLRTKMSHEGGLANIDEAIAGMQIRLGLGAMGEVTSVEPTAVERGIHKVRDIAEWLNKKHVLVPMLFNEATIGSGVAIALSAANFLKTAPFRAVAAITGPIGSITGGALAGGLFAGWREYGQLQRDYLTHLREKETGAQFTEMQKRRAWFEKFAVQQRSATEMITTMRGSLYEPVSPSGEPGPLKATLSDDELRTAFATVADTQARKAVSETGPKRIGLIQYSNREAIESERTALDITANKALTDLDTYLASHTDQATSVLGGNTFSDFMVKLTTTQTHVLREGVNVIASQDDPVNATLNLVSQYAPEAAIVKRRWPFASKLLTDGEKALGLDAMMEEFKKEARVESVKYGVKAGVISAAMGTAFHAISDIGHTAATTQTTEHAATIPISKLTGEHTMTFHGDTFQIPKELAVTEHVENGQTFYDAKIDLPLLDNLKGQHDYIIGSHLNEQQFKSALEKLGMTIADPHKTGEIIASTHESFPIPHLTSPDGSPINASLPPGYEIKYIDSAHNWQILDEKDKLIATVKFTDTGDFAGTPTEIANLNATLEHQGYHIASPIANHIPHEQIAASGGSEVGSPPPEPMIDVPAKDLPEGGMWDYFLAKAHLADPKSPNTVAAGNGLKNLFRMYTYEHNNDNIDVPEGPHTGYIGEHLRPASFGRLPDGNLNAVSEFDLSRIPNDATIKLPENVFGAEGTAWFTTHNDQAIAHLNELVSAGHIGDQTIRGPMDAINYLYNSKNTEEHLQGIVLKLGYLGQDDKLPTAADVQTIMSEMSGAPVGGAPSSLPPEVTQYIDIHSPTLSFVYPEDQPGQIFAEKITVPMVETVTTFARDTAASQAPWIPIFIPYREVLEAESAETIQTPAPKDNALLSPFGHEETYLTHDARIERKSPRLKENPEAKLSQSEEVAWYLSTLSPEEKEALDALSTQEYPPMNPEVRAVVTIPVIQGGGGTIYERLNRYAKQTNADGSTFDPKRMECIVYDAHITPPEGEISKTLPGSTKEEVDRFTREHPDMRILYLTHNYQEPPTSGRIKRDITNFALSRITTLPVDTSDVAIISDNGTSGPIAPTALSSVIDTLDSTPTVDLVSGSYQLPEEAYAEYPMLFAQHRAFELMDALVRHGDAGSVPGVYSGNIGIRAGTLAAVGGYNPDAQVAEDREMAWMVREGRGKAESMMTLPTLTAVIDPQETVYTHLQQLGLADPAVPLTQNDVYKDMPWKDMAKKAQESYTQEQLETHLSNMYTHMYPTLKESNPARFDAYFRRTMDSLGLAYEIKDGKIVISDMTNLETNMSAPIDVELFAKDAAPSVVEATPALIQTPRETLTSLAGEATPTGGETGNAESIAAETQTMEEGISAKTEPTTSGISSPEISVEEEPVATAIETLPETETTIPPTVEAEPAPPQPSEQEIVPPTETVATTMPTAPPQEVAQQRDLSAEASAKVEGVEDRIQYVLGKTNESLAGVQVTTGELMDYVRSSVELPGARITEGKIVINGSDVKLTDMKAKTIVGEAQFSGELTTDPTQGLIVKKDSVNLHLPLLALPWKKGIHDSLDNFNNLVLTHLNGRIDPKWKAERIDVVDEKLEVTFSKKPAK